MAHIEYIDWGFAFRVGDTIYINRNLPKYKKLYDRVLAHEEKHTGQVTKKDLEMDIADGLAWTEMMAFNLRHPKSIVHYIPLSIIKGKIAIDWFAIMVYGGVFIGGMMLWSMMNQ